MSSSKSIRRQERPLSITQKEKRCIAVVKVEEFSNVAVHRQDEGEIALNVSSYLDVRLRVTVYPNGFSPTTLGTVCLAIVENISIEEKDTEYLQSVQLTLVISVIDAGGDKRLTRSFVKLRDIHQGFDNSHLEFPSLPDELVIDDHVRRSFLLDRPTEFLPGDTLTLEIEVIASSCYLMQPEKTDLGKYLGLEYMVEGPEGKGLYLSVDADFARRLAQESSVLGFIMSLDTPDRFIKFPEEETQLLRMIAMIFTFRNRREGIVIPLRTILDLYSLAEKYDIPAVTDICRRWLKLCLIWPENFDEISSFADRWEDKGLQVIVEASLTGSGDSHSEDELWECSRLEGMGQLNYHFCRKYDSETSEIHECEVFNFYT